MSSKREELLKKKDLWFAQRLAAQEREKLAAERSEEIQFAASETTTLFQPDQVSTSKLKRASETECSSKTMLSSDDRILDRITERITSRIRDEVRTEILRDVEADTKKKGVQFKKLEGFLAAELEQATCPICFELMVPPVHTPTLLFPCGHTFCTTCITAHCKANRHNCPYCRSAIQSQAPNVMMQQLIESFAQKKALDKAWPAAESTITQTSAPPPPSLNSSLQGDEAVEEIERYIREWRGVSMRCRIYDNEAADCLRDIEALRARREASRLVRDTLSAEMAAAQRRLLEVQEEIDLIQAQAEQQRERDERLEEEAADRVRRHRLLASTREGLEAERVRIRMLAAHYLPAGADVEALLDGTT